MKLACAAAFWMLALPAFAGDDHADSRRRVRELGRLRTVPATHEAEGFRADGFRALFYGGLPYRGKPTRIFAWYGVPADRKGKVPAVVLVHGGGGTAFKEWILKWNQHGFAAISIAVEGQTDERQPGVTPAAWKRHDWAGPARDGIYSDSAKPLEEQWMYHAVGATVLANSLLRSFPEVDAGRVGIMGISWGGVITSTVIGIDTRFAFAIPTYGCGSLADAENHWGQALGSNELYRRVWDPVHWLPNARMPLLWLTWLYDNHFPLPSQRASYLAARGPRMVAVLPDMKHSHPAGWNPPESYSFAKSVLSKRPWLRQLSARRDGNTVVAEFVTAQPIEGAALVSTTGSGYSGSRKWTTSPATLHPQGGRVRVKAELPGGSTGWFFNVHAGGLTASSDFAGK